MTKKYLILTGLSIKSDHEKDINEIKNNYVTTSALTSKRRGYVPYND